MKRPDEQPLAEACYRMNGWERFKIRVWFYWIMALHHSGLWLNQGLTEQDERRAARKKR